MTLAEKWKLEGLEKGLQQGLEKGRLEVARSMLLEGINKQTVVKVTGLSEEDLSQLLN
ncbi:MAG: hypothetical protein J0H12_01755 [Candidatus Paracaedimonas acanthamoebae]|uniref:Transposase n=1 Tax=Candidatus Paracaedimonas acanthamoebae TaxID=244581 RepID=A0A8J7PZV3_9PROT|nr:hypothetical protein [Candidatus Paracaedimonas acanthamoebae]